MQEVVDEADKVAGVSYDLSAHTVTVTVEADPESDGDLIATVSYGQDDEGEELSSLTITNEYNGTTTANIEATKSFNNWGKADSFDFRLSAADGAPMPEDAADDGTVTKTATEDAPTVNFGTMT